jgi:hypothetical protein
MSETTYGALPASFIIVSIIGFSASVLYWNRFEDKSWPFTFAIFCVVFFVASLISMRSSAAIEVQKQKASKKK